MAMLYRTGAGGARLSAIDEGEGSAILVVHPGGGDASSWSTVARLLADEFRVVRIQRRICTPEASIALPHSMAAEAADILTIAGGLARPLLVGHSSGAVAALEAALASPTAFAALVLYEPPLATTSPIAGEAGTRARAALDAGDPVLAMQIHIREIGGMPAADVTAKFAVPEGAHSSHGSLRRRSPRTRRWMRSASESSATPRLTCQPSSSRASAARRISGSA